MEQMKRDTIAESILDKVPSVLFVDDESNILSSLNRLFRPKNYKIFIASSGADGLEILQQQEIDVVVSDMRMPEMDGAQFLEQVKNNWPQTERILLTGYSDMNAAIDAINKGGIFRYISKPWEDNDMLLTIDQAIDHKRLREERLALLQLTVKQNEELQSLNNNLDEKVRYRTQELNQTMSQLELAHNSLKKQYISTINICTNLIEMRLGAVTGHYRRVADLARNLATEAGMEVSEAQNVMLAGLLVDIGKLSLPDGLLSIPYEQVAPLDRPKYEKYPIMGEATLMALDNLHDAAKLIRHHAENYNGSGFPARLKGEAIPLGARILALANDYESLIDGSLLHKRLTVGEAKDYIMRNRGKRYDPNLVDLLYPRLSVTDIKNRKDDCYFTTPKQLKPGMIVGQDFVLENGLVLFAKGQTLNEKLITKIQELETQMDARFRVYIKNID